MIKQNFIYPNITEKHYRFGSNQLVGTVINPTGDWRSYTPQGELQNRNGIESFACYVEASQHAIATILEEQFSITDSDFASRFNALLSNGSEFGGDPLAGGDSIRNDGLIPDSMMTFADYITSWDDFHSWKGADQEKCIQTGKDFISKWKLNYDIVFERDESIDDKYRKLKESLNYSPSPLSIYGLTDENGNYVPKPEGASDTHLVLAVYVEGDVIWVWDTYLPFLKKLPAGYSPDFAMRWGVTKIEEVVKKKTLWQRLFEWFMSEKLIVRDFKKFWIKYERPN
jgi:hypothetical protein